MILYEYYNNNGELVFAFNILLVLNMRLPILYYFIIFMVVFR